MAHKTISAHQLLTGSKHEILKQTGESTLPSETDEKITKFVESKNGEVNELKLKQQISKLVAEVAEGAEDIKDLKKQLSQLRTEKNTEKKEWEKHVKSLETQVKKLIDENKCLTAQVNDLNQENAMLAGKNMELEEQIAKLQKRVTVLTGELTEVRKECQCLQDKLSSMVSAENDLVLGELCWQIQSMIFKKILPPSCYSEKLPYNLHFITHEIAMLPSDRDKAEAKNAWASLKEELKYQPQDIYRLTVVMREIQSERNSTALPKLTEEILYQSAKRMKDEGQEGAKSYESVMQLINLWKILEDM